MKKTLALLMAITLIFSLFACNLNTDKIVENLGEQLNKNLERGTTDGDVYTSDFSGITFTKPSGWRYYTDQEIADSMGVALEELEKDNLTSLATKVSTVYDMWAINEYTGDNIIIGYENTDLTAGGSVTEEEYCRILSDSLSAEGFKTKEPSATVVLCGNEYLKATFTIESEGSKIAQTYYFKGFENYMCFIIITETPFSDVEDFDTLFS